MELAYLIFRGIRILALLSTFIRRYMLDKGKYCWKNSGIFIGAAGISITLITLIFEINFSANCLLSIFILAWFIIYSIIEIMSKMRGN